MLEEFGPGIWTVHAPLRLAGAAFGTRMTVVRVGEDGLVLIAPVPIDDALEAELRALGTVRGLVAPNAFHHFYLLDAAVRFPDAVCFLAQGVAEKLERVPTGAQTLGAEPDPLWQAELAQALVGGAPKVNEVVFLHRPSGTLVLTDLCFHFDPPPKGWTGFFLRLAGAHGRLAVSRLMRSLLKDRGAVRASVSQILEWDFDRLVVTHGENLRSDAKQRFREATADL